MAGIAMTEQPHVAMEDGFRVWLLQLRPVTGDAAQQRQADAGFACVKGGRCFAGRDVCSRKLPRKGDAWQDKACENAGGTVRNISAPRQRQRISRRLYGRPDGAYRRESS